MTREKLERETGIEPATNGLGSRYSTIELLPRSTEIIPCEIATQRNPIALRERRVFRVPFLSPFEREQK